MFKGMICLGKKKKNSGEMALSREKKKTLLWCECLILISVLSGEERKILGKLCL